MGEYLRLLIYGPQLHCRSWSPNAQWSIPLWSADISFPNKVSYLFMEKRCQISNLPSTWQRFLMFPACLICTGTRSPKCIVSMLKYSDWIEFGRQDVPMTTVLVHMWLRDGPPQTVLSRQKSLAQVSSHRNFNHGCVWIWSYGHWIVNCCTLI